MRRFWRPGSGRRPGAEAGSFGPVRSRLTQIVVDVSAGPYKDRTVMFLGSEDGRVLKVLASTHPNDSFGSRLLEDIDVYNPSR